MLAHVSTNDDPQPGGLIGSGTLPDGSGLEIDRRFKPVAPSHADRKDPGILAQQCPT
ncbi:hypothetical protein [Streptomyces sp. SID12501]|uniref:Uncharacterized protein n=1 Tax=Streptomyces sp. SID12501 TaxID=2706042 RepID=A0A6B3BW23_9ACTN|nr:hypothetical protein [Streptomyces sp. SID12501]NEC88539.1 hypothetical protein [Streptomyces sp. SID12501]